MLLLLFSTRWFLWILIITCTNGDMSHFVAVGMTNFGLWRLTLRWVLGYVHTVPDRFLLRCKSCSGTVWTRINVLLRCRNCSEAFPVWTEALSVTQFATLPFDLKRLFSKTRFRCNFCYDKSVHTWFGPFQKPIRYGTFHFQQLSGAVLFRSRNCFESRVPSVNRSPIQYTFCGAPFHYPVQCEHSLNHYSSKGGQNSVIPIACDVPD